VLKALAKSPEDRFSSMAELADALRDCLAPDHPGALRPPRNSTPSNLSMFAPPQKKKAAWSRRTTLLAAGALILVALGARAVLQQNGSRRPVSAKDEASLEQKNLGLRGQGVAPASSGAAPASSPGAAVSPGAVSPGAGVPPGAAAVTPGAVSPGAGVPSVVAAPRPSPAPPTNPVMAHGTGLLSLDSVPWANVYVGDRLLGMTPLDRLALPAGRVELRLENPELEASTTYVVQIESGRQVSRFVDWDAKRGAKIPPN
jgi:hypothetical protein